MPTPPPIPPAARSPFGPDGEPKLLQDVSHRVQDAARRLDDEMTSAVDARSFNPWPALVGAALAGYVLSAVIHRR